MIRHLVILWFCLAGLPGYAKSWALAEDQRVVGQYYTITPRTGDTLPGIAMRYSMGIEEMRRANPTIDPIRPLTDRSRIIIPEAFILPDARQEGIVINLPEYRLYYFPPDSHDVIIFPIGIGRAGWKTPLGLTKITALSESPIWRPTANVRLEAARNGTPIPAYFPAGLDNPLGQYVLRLGWPTYLIHGTNRPDGVGARVSAGCIRMLPDDIDYLFHHVTVGTPVRVLNQPVKYAPVNKDLFVQTYPALVAQESDNPVAVLQEKFSNASEISQDLRNKIMARNGAVVVISNFFHDRE